MKKTAAVAATALLGLTTLAGATAAPAAGPAASSAVAKVHTLRLVLHETASHNVGRHRFVGTDTARRRLTDKIVGYDSISGTFDRQTTKVSVDVALSLKGGIIVGRVRGVFDQQSPVFTGRILKGTGKFAAAEGTIVVKLTSSKKSFLTVSYLL